MELTLGLVGLVATIVFGAWALVVSNRSEQRARAAGRDAASAISDLRAAAAQSAVALAEIRNLASAAAEAVASLRGEAWTLIAKSHTLMLEKLLAAPPREVRAPGEIGSGDEESPDASEPGTPAPLWSPSSADVVRELQALSLRDPGVRAIDLFHALGGAENSYAVVQHLYALRAGGVVAWEDAILSPETVLRLPRGSADGLINSR